MSKFSKNPLIKPGMLERPRIYQIFSEASQYALSTVVAPHGYGKTVAAAYFVRRSSLRTLWFHCAETDCLPTHFFQHFLMVLENILPENAARVPLSFPENPPQWEAFLRLLSTGLYGGKPVLLVVDDFHLVNAPVIHGFFDRLLKAELENLSLMLISSEKIELETTGMRIRGSHYHITRQELCFTKEEQLELFVANDVHLPADTLDAIYETIYGWPLPLHLTVQHFRRNADASLQMPHPITADMDLLFEREYFHKYPAQMQLLLIKLSLLPGFSSFLVERLVADNVQQMADLLADNLFVAYDTNAKLLVFQNAYRKFLQAKKHRLSAEEMLEVFSIAGESFAKDHHLIETIECYEACGQYEDVLEALLSLINSRIGISEGQARYMWKKLENLPASIHVSYPVAEYLEASLYLAALQVDEADATLQHLIQRLENQPDPQSIALLGEAMIVKAGIQMLRNQPDFGQFYQRACQYLPNGTSFKKDVLLVENNRNFSLAHHRPGAIAQMREAVELGIPHMNRATHGGQGIAELFFAEAAQLTMDIGGAEKHLYNALHTAIAHRQMDLVCNAYILLAELAAYQGDYDGMREQVLAIQAYAKENESIAMREMADYAASWLAIETGDESMLSYWMIAPLSVQEAKPMMAAGRNKMLYAAYLFTKKRYTALIPFLESIISFSFRRGLWTDRLYAYIFLAIVYDLTHDEARSHEVFQKAYDMAYHNQILFPFVKCGRPLLPLLHKMILARSEAYDTSWLINIHTLAGEYEKRRTTVHRLHKKFKNSAKGNAEPIQLTKREKEILLSISQGSTREVIAGQYHISPNTVKTIVTNIYNKLGAINRADAVRIAIKVGLL